jgi:hypothetical protein
VRKSHSLATKLAATFLARMSSVDAAASTFCIDPRTVRGWVDRVELPEDRWTAIRDVLLARGSEMAAKGDTRGLPAILTGAGIAERNVRYATLIARREARRAEEEAPPEPLSPMQVATQALSDEQRRMVVAEIDVLLEARSLGLEVGVQVPRPDAGLQVAEWFGVIATLPDEEVAARTEAAEARLRELHEQQYEDRRLLPGVDGRGDGIKPTPQPAEGPMASVVPMRPGDRAEGVLVDVGEPWQWRPL